MVAIVILMYKGWQDTVYCIESVLKSDYKAYHIIVVDNCSPDNSWDMLLNWANGSAYAFLPSSHLAHLYEPPCEKPLVSKQFSEEEAEQDHFSLAERQLTFIRAKINKGYSAGNNIGIRYAQQKGVFQFVWLLNNDTLVSNNTLSYLVRATQNSLPKVGIMGSKLLYYHQPDTIQCLGGATYNPWFAYVKQVGNRKKNNLLTDYKPKIDFISGASMFVRMTFINDVGLLKEDYFLYFEEIDWCTRGRKKGWKIDCETEAIVFHKEGGAIGSSDMSMLADYYYLRNKLLIARKFHSKLQYVTVAGSLLLSILVRLCRLEFKKARQGVSVLYQDVMRSAVR